MLDVGTPGLSWRRLASLIRHLPPESATQRAIRGDDVTWGLTEHLLAAVVDALNMANWQRQGDKRAKRPRPLPRPGVSDPGEKRYGGRRTYTVDELRRRLGRR